MDETSYTRDQVADLLKGHDIQPTHQRVEIAFALFSCGVHLCADQVLSMVNEAQPETSRATVYNTLKLLVAKGLVREVIADPSRIFYDPNTHPHYHLYDSRTGELTDIDASRVRITGFPELPEGMITEGVDVIVRVRSAEPTA